MQAPTFNSEDEEAQFYLSQLRDGSDSEKITARDGLAAIFARRGLFAEAVELYERNVQAGVRTPALFERLSEVYRAIGDAASADAALAEANLQRAARPAAPPPVAPPPSVPLEDDFGVAPARPASTPPKLPAAERPVPPPPLPDVPLSDDFALDDGAMASLSQAPDSPAPGAEESSPTGRRRRVAGRLAPLTDDDGLDSGLAETGRLRPTRPDPAEGRVIQFPGPGAGWTRDAQMEDVAWERPRNGLAGTGRGAAARDEPGSIGGALPAYRENDDDDPSMSPDLLVAAAAERRARFASRRAPSQRRVSGPLFITGVVIFLIILPVVLLALLVVNPIALYLQGKSAGPTIDVQASGPARIKVAPGRDTAWYIQSGTSVQGLWATNGLELALEGAPPESGGSFTITPPREQSWGAVISVVQQIGRVGHATHNPPGQPLGAGQPAGVGTVVPGKIVGQVIAPRMMEGAQFNTATETIEKPVELVVVSSTALWFDRFGNSVLMFFDADRWLVVTISALLTWCVLAGGAALVWRVRGSR